MELIQCAIEDIQLLAKLNKELYEDENNDYIPAIDVLEESLNIAMEIGSKAFLFKQEGEVAGYALVKTQTNPYYLSHFFICKHMRRKHLGTEAFHLLLQELTTDTIDLDVFCWNHRGQEFWKSLGFEERCIVMRRGK